MKTLILNIVMFISMFWSYSSFEDKESVKKRFEFYDKIREFSNNTVGLQHDSFAGLYCQAQDHINPGEITLKIPIEYGICPYFLFPFKFELSKYIGNIKGLNETIGKEQKSSVYLLTFALMYYLDADKDYVKQYIYDNNIEAYKNVDFEPFKGESSFPKIMLGKSTMYREHMQYLISKGFLTEEGMIELDAVHSNVLRDIIRGDHQIAMYHWTKSAERFKYAYGLVMSRGMTLRLNEYYTLVDYKGRSPKYTPAEKENLALNQKICNVVGCPCVIMFIDVCNHYQPKHRDLRDKRAIILDTTKDHYINLSPREYDIGDEISYTYSNDPNALVLLMNYGFVMKKNIFNSLRIKITDRYTLTTTQLKICKELYCVDPSITDPYSVPTDKNYLLFGDEFNDQLLNYSKVRALRTLDVEKGNMEIIKKLKKKEKINFYNELAAWIFYMKKLKDDLNETKQLFVSSIKENQFYRNKLKIIEDNWSDEDAYRQKWGVTKHFEQISLLDLTYKSIIFNQVVHAEKKIIKTLHDDITRIKQKLVK